MTAEADYNEKLHAIAHELRSAITVISGNAELAIVKSPELEDVVQPIISATERLEDVLKRLVG